jgi:hypothetical protein
MFLIFSVTIIIYTIEISYSFTEFEGEDDDIEDEGIEGSLKWINRFITEKVHEIETKLKQETAQYNINLLKMTLDEWKAFL